MYVPCIGRKIQADDLLINKESLLFRTNVVQLTLPLSGQSTFTYIRSVASVKLYKYLQVVFSFIEEMLIIKKLLNYFMYVAYL